MSPASHDLVLVKAATRREHLRENLWLMQAAEGSRAVFSYHGKWLAPGVLDAAVPGARIVLALGNTPYRDVLPLRSADLLGISDRDGLTYRFELELGDFLDPDPRYGESLACRPSDARPGGAFVVLPAEDVDATPVAPEDRASAWRRAVDALRVHQSYAGSVFLRLQGYEIDGVRVPARAGAPAVAAGQELTLLVESRCDHIPEAERSEIRLLADAAAWSIPLEQPLVAEGLMRFPVAAEAEDRPKLAFSLGVRPRWADSSVLELEIPVLAEGTASVVPDPASAPTVPETRPSPPVATTPVTVPGLDPQAVSLRPQDGQRLLRALRRDGWSPSLAVLEEHLLRWFPGDPKLEEARLEVLLAAGAEDAAAERLYALPPEVLAQIDPWLRFRAAVHRSDGEGALAAISEIGDFGPQHLDELAFGLGRLSSPAMDQALSRLADTLLGERTLSELLVRLDPADMGVAVATKVADLMDVALSKEESLAFLQRRIEIGFDAVLATRAADLAAALGGRQPLGPWIEELMRVELDREGPEMALARLNDLQHDLSYRQELELVRLVAVRLKLLAPMVPTIERVARAALAHGDFDAVASLAGLLAKVDDPAAVRLVADLERALERTKVVKIYLRLLYENRLERAAGLAQERTLILVGGPKEEARVRDHLKRTLRFQTVEWLPCERTKNPPLGKLDKVQERNHVVVILTGYIGHDTSNAVAEACDGLLTPIRCPTGGADEIERRIVDRLAPPKG